MKRNLLNFLFSKIETFDVKKERINHQTNIIKTFLHFCSTINTLNSCSQIRSRYSHRHLRKIDLFMARTACLVGTVSGGSKNALGRGNAISGQITKLEQTIFSIDIYGCSSAAK